MLEPNAPIKARRIVPSQEARTGNLDVDKMNISTVAVDDRNATSISTTYVSKFAFSAPLLWINYQIYCALCLQIYTVSKLADVWVCTKSNSETTSAPKSVRHVYWP